MSHFKIRHFVRDRGRLPSVGTMMLNVHVSFIGRSDVANFPIYAGEYDLRSKK